MRSEPVRRKYAFLVLKEVFMPALEWNESFSVNNPEIDAQHCRWIDIYNEMDERLTEGDSDSIRTLARDSLEAMREYALFHFMSEEAYMAQIGYPDIAAHARIHRNFETRIDDYIVSIHEGRLLLNTTLINIVKNWLVEHIMGEDKKYARFSGR